MTNIIDRDESIASMQPMRIDNQSGRMQPIVELAFELTAQSSSFHASLPAGIRTALADLVRAMNCYYSNLIEGHDTHPIDIERALKNDFSDDPVQRDLQREATAHIAVQEWIDNGGLVGRAHTIDGLKEVHARFCVLLPEDMLTVKNPDTGEIIPVVPGEFRERDVAVGRHVPVSPGAVPRFMEHFEWAYGRVGKADAVTALAAAHHRFAWIHPFQDGNGRVGRLMSHAMLLDALDTGGVWSIARGLGRSVEEYKSHLAACDMQRRNDLDGRGNLSEEALAAFSDYFLRTCIDQVAFMRSLVEPDRLRVRIRQWIAEEAALGHISPKLTDVMDALLYRGELPRGELEDILGVTDRHARRLIEPLMDLGVLASETSRAPLRLAFPASLASRWMPGLFPPKPASES